MSRPYGPVALTAGVASSVDVDASAAYALIENSSIFMTMGVSFQVNQPPVVPTFSGAPYVGAIQAGGTKLFRLPVNDGTWTGRIWMLPISQATLSAATGSTSSIQSALITTFAQGEDPINTQGVIRGLDLTSQPRIITVPMAESSWRNGSVTAGANLNDEVAYGGTTIALSAANLMNGACNLYVFGFYASMENVGTGLFDFRARFQDAGHAGLASIRLFRANLSRAGTFGPTQDYSRVFPTPLVWNATIPATAVEIGFSWTNVGFVGGTFGGQRLNCEIVAGLDLVNSAYPGDYGNWTLHTGSGAIF